MSLKYYYHCTCSACPEQYDVYKSKKDFDLQKEPIAYIRLRWGSLYCEVPFNGRTVYKYNFDDSYKGMMEEEERKLHLSSIDNAIFKFLNSKTLKS